MSIDRATFVRVAIACNLSAAFSDTLSEGKGRTDTGKVDCRKFAALMEKVAFMYGKDCTSKYYMLPLLLAKAGIPADDFRWRGNATEGIEAHPAAKVFQTLCTEYLQGLYPYETWETASSAPQVRRKDIPSDILATLDI